MTRASEIRKRLAERIVSGDLRPGSPLEEQILAEEFGVSRTPVRDALRELAGTGLVNLQPHRGARVAEVKPGQLEELFDAQTEIEAVCARVAAFRLSSTERRRLMSIQEASETCVRDGDHEGYSECDDQLHGLIYAGTHNAVLNELASRLRRRASPFRVRQFYQSHDRMKSSFNEHGAVVEAITRPDPEAAMLAMRTHVANTSFNVLRYFTEDGLSGGADTADEIRTAD